MTKGLRKYAVWLLIILLISSCQTAPSANQKHLLEPYTIEKPAHFPTIPIPADNPMSAEKVKLGEALFFDPILSSDSSISCASCHFPGFAFSDTVALSRGVHDSIGKRNAPPLINIAYAPVLFRDGGAQSLEMQLYTPIEDDHEMNLDIDEAVLRLQESNQYRPMFEEVFDTLPTVFGLTRALAAYERTLIGGSSRYDTFLTTGDSSIFNEQEKLGLQLFYRSDLNCAACHSGFNLTDHSFRNNGLYETYTDWGHANLSMDSSDIGKFRVPSLRNIALTAPYMHDGSFTSLESVIRHYANGGKAHPHKDPSLQGFVITDNETDALIQFFHTLTDTAIIEH